GFYEYIFMDSSSETSSYEFVLDHGYPLDLLQAALTMFLFVQLSAEAGNSGLYLFFPWFPSEVCGRLMTHKTIILQVLLFPCSSLHPFFPAWYFTRCCKDLTTFSKLDSSENYLLCYLAIWNGDSQLNRVLEIQHMLIGTQVSKVLIFVVVLRWKCNFFPVITVIYTPLMLMLVVFLSWSFFLTCLWSREDEVFKGATLLMQDELTGASNNQVGM
ncbi:hypothetical protein MKX03_022349, partial [Papaver bracteatum]